MSINPNFHKTRWRLVYAWIIVFTGLTVYSFSSIHNVTSQNHKLAIQGVEAHNAICRFRQDLSGRVKESERFLKRHPKGIPGLATGDEIRASLVNQKITLKSFDNFKCHE